MYFAIFHLGRSVEKRACATLPCYSSAPQGALWIRGGVAVGAALATHFATLRDWRAAGSSKMAAQRRSLLQSVRKPTRSPGWEGWELWCALGARAVVFRRQSVDPLPRSSVGACSAPATRGRLASRLLCACAPQAGPLGVKGAGVLPSGSVLEPEGDVAPPNGPSGARTRLIINNPGCVMLAASPALCGPPHSHKLGSSTRSLLGLIVIYVYGRGNRGLESGRGRINMSACI